MDLPIVEFFERWFSKKSHNTNLFGALLVGGIVFVLLATLLSFALASSDDVFDQDDLPFFESSALVWFMRHCLVLFLPLGVTFYVLLAIMRLEFLFGHIGEKRLHDLIVHNTSPFRFPISGRLSIYGAVFFFALVRMLISVSTFFSLRPRSDNRSCAKKVQFDFISGG